jgi:hypothetical protein
LTAVSRQHAGEDLAPPGGVEPEHRVVEEDDGGIVDERAGDPDALAYRGCRSR